MTNQQILEKAIAKAIEGGWRGANGIKPELWQEQRVGKFYQEMTVKNFLEQHAENIVIFNHDFAKALWPDHKHKDGVVTEMPFVSSGEYWKYHLQQMVLAEDPVKYLGDNI